MRVFKRHFGTKCLRKWPRRQGRTARVLSSSPHLGSPFELLFDQEDLVASGSCMQYRWLGFDHSGNQTRGKTEAGQRLDRFSTAGACNTATGTFLPCAERVLDLYRPALEFVTSGKRGFTYCSKTREVWEVLKKKKEVLRVEKNWGTKDRNKGLGMKVRLLHSGVKYHLQNSLATNPQQKLSIKYN